MRGRSLLFIPLLAVTLGLASPALAAPLVVDRIVAVVDDGILLLSELRGRARPFKGHLDAGLSPPQRAAAEAAIESDVLAKMIEERLIAGEAARLHVSVTEDEVMHAMGLIATQASTTREGLLALAAKQGLSEAEYRAELGRQILEGKVLQIKIPPGERKAAAYTAAVVEKQRREMVASLRTQAYVEVRP